MEWCFFRTRGGAERDHYCLGRYLSVVRKEIEALGERGLTRSLIQTDCRSTGRGLLLCTCSVQVVLGAAVAGFFSILRVLRGGMGPDDDRGRWLLSIV